MEYLDNPRLENEEDLYYEGTGTTWGTDLDDKRYWKRYKLRLNTNDVVNSRYEHLNEGDIINEKARIQKIVMECLESLGIKRKIRV